MKSNIHEYERVGRIIIGTGLTSLAFLGPASPWFFLGLVPLITGIIGWCPPYALLGISTCSTGRIKKINMKQKGDSNA